MRSAPTRRCPRCGDAKPLQAFSSNRRAPDGLDTYCRACNAKRMRDKRERYLAAGCCADCGQSRGGSYSVRYCLRCARDKARLSTLGTRQLRLRVLRAYSDEAPSCACCGERRLPFLTLDHLNNDGRAHRRRLKGWPGVFRELARNGFPPGYRVFLCFNCNLARYAYEVCPHQGVIDPGPRPIKPRKAVPVGDETGPRRRCTRCTNDLPYSAFYGDKGTRSGLQSRCRTCTRDASLGRQHMARHEALVHYAAGEPRCACCGECEERFHVLDHIGGEGPQPESGPDHPIEAAALNPRRLAHSTYNRTCVLSRTTNRRAPKRRSAAHV